MVQDGQSKHEYGVHIIGFEEAMPNIFFPNAHASEIL